MKYFIFLVGMMSFLMGCTGNPITGSKEPVKAIKYCIAQLPPINIKFLQDGHLFTTLSITAIAGYPENRQLAISYYSQYPDIDPDYEATPVAIKYLLLPWKWEWRNDITGVLHSLHGGNRQAIDSRRETIKAELSKTLKDDKLDWLSGLIIHAYADSYAHTKNVFNSKEEQAYNVWLGHAIPSLFGNSPDNIKNELNEPKYLGYVDALYTTIKTNSADDRSFKNFLKFVDELDCQNGLCEDFHALYNNENPSSNSRINRFKKCMNTHSRPLSKNEVQRFINMIK